VRIAQVAPLLESVPPLLYGGTARIVSYLTEALVRQGHAVTLFASGDSRTRARLVPVTAESLRLAACDADWPLWHTLMLDRVFAMSDEFDILHFPIDGLQYPLARRSRVPCVTTMHGRLDLPVLTPLHRHFREHPLVSISRHQRLPLQAANWCGLVYHGLPRDLYRFHPRGGDYLAFIGRASPEKGVDRAIEIAVACGMRLRIAAKVDRTDVAYFERWVRPLLGHPLVEFIGEIGDRDKEAFIGNARALLFPIDWPEPFGLVMIEAFACGTPVIAYDRGSVREVMVDGVTGYIVGGRSDAVKAARAIHRIDRRACRQVFEARFTAERMAADYIRVYERLARRPEEMSQHAGYAADR
jgi:glycosyltransferase involved in cell wall biosynthesis